MSKSEATPLKAPATMPASRLARRLQPSLPTAEIALYTATWSTAIIYALYNVYKCSRRYFARLDQRDFELGWLGKTVWRKDHSDSEWHVFSDVIVGSLPWLAVHFLGSQSLRRLNRSLLPTFYFLLSCIYVGRMLGAQAVLYLCLQPVTFFAVARSTRSSALVYVTAITFMLAKELGPLRTLQEAVLSPHQDFRASYIASVSHSWINSRCLSFCLDLIWGEVPSSGSFLSDLVNLLCYAFYLPLAILGPLVNYREFHRGLVSDPVPLDGPRVLHLASTLARYLFWMAFNHLVLHAFYFNALHYDLSLLGSLDLWSVCGVAFAIGQFFHMKYVVFYGVPRAFLVADNIEPPAPTKCISRIHLYSDMWRYFDNGLYNHIHKYYYIPMLGLLGASYPARLAASAVTFSYVFVWHGLANSVAVWSVLNFAGISIEAAASALATCESYRRAERWLLSPRGRRRLHSAAGAPLHLMSILSQFYFLMGKEAGDLVASRACLSWHNLGTPIILIFTYCAAQTSFEVRNWEIRAKLVGGRDSGS